MPNTSQTSVLVIGGSLNGLTMALLLAHHGVRCIVVERHPATTVQYKFAGISPRSMEIFRALGIDDEIRANATGDQAGGELARARNLADPDVKFLGKAWGDSSQLGGSPPATCDQDHLEPILRARAEQLGADVRFSTELVELEASDREVRARIVERQTRRTEVIVADYAVAADGAGGTMRERLGIGRHGPGVLQHWMNLIFETDLQPVLHGRRITSCFVTDLNASIIPRDDRWRLSLQYRPDRGERPEDFDQARTAELVRRAAGRSDVAVRLFDARSWEVTAYVMDAFRRGRVFFLGDAAHTMPPTGGFGGNTGIHDAHNLAWKLAYVLAGTADPALLASYDAERRFVADRTLGQALARLAAWFDDPTRRLPPTEPILDDHAVVFGARYPDGALIPEAGAPGDAFEDPRKPSGRPGVRAPHIVVERGATRRPIHDLFGKRFTLLTGRDGEDWAAASARLPLASIRLGVDALDVAGTFASAYGVGPRGAVLVRPDGVVAWRSRAEVADPGGVVADVLAKLLGRRPS